MTLAEMADYLKVAKRSLVRMARQGDIPATKVASQWRFMRSVVDDWLIGRMKSLPDRELKTLIESEKLPVPLSALIRPQLVRLDIEDLGLEGVLRLLTEPLVREQLLNNSGDFVEKLVEREEMVSTAIFPGIAIPHARKPEECPVVEPRIVVGVSRDGVDFNSLDGQPTFLFFLICANQVLLHLKIIAELALIFRRPELVESLKVARNPHQVVSILLDH
ncbi:MAG: PTS sugar transporter subunit IIA [Spirochaetaceae bacterium]|nr:MAG: PTS sugar transporter subunit IIA [Spirochaetaceae bacterium]